MRDSGRSALGQYCLFVDDKMFRYVAQPLHGLLSYNCRNSGCGAGKIWSGIVTTENDLLRRDFYHTFTVMMRHTL